MRALALQPGGARSIGGRVRRQVDFLTNGAVTRQTCETQIPAVRSRGRRHFSVLRKG